MPDTMPRTRDHATWNTMRGFTEKTRTLPPTTVPTVRATPPTEKSRATEKFQVTEKFQATEGSKAKEKQVLRRDLIAAQLQRQVERLNMLLEQAETEAESATDEAGRIRERRLAELRQLARSASQQLAELDTVGEDHWDRLVVEGQKFERAFIHSYNYFKSQFA